MVRPRDDALIMLHALHAGCAVFGASHLDMPCGCRMSDK